LENMANLAGEKATPHIERMKEIRNMMKAAGIEKTFVLDPAITRGLDYYTGVVYETFLNDLPSIGSVCSGGRYDNLAGLYMKDRIPGVGSSIGLDRLIAGLEQLGATNKKGSFLDCEIFCLDKNLSVHYQAVASALRSKGVNVEVFADEKKIGQQYTVAEKKGIPFGIMILGVIDDAIGIEDKLPLPSLALQMDFNAFILPDITVAAGDCGLPGGSYGFTCKVDILVIPGECPSAGGGKLATLQIPGGVKGCAIFKGIDFTVQYRLGDTESVGQGRSALVAHGAGLHPERIHFLPLQCLGEDIDIVQNGETAFQFPVTGSQMQHRVILCGHPGTRHL
jgi:hypothetical protein